MDWDTSPGLEMVRCARIILRGDCTSSCLVRAAQVGWPPWLRRTNVGGVQGVSHQKAQRASSNRRYRFEGSATVPLALARAGIGSVGEGGLVGVAGDAPSPADAVAARHDDDNTLPLSASGLAKRHLRGRVSGLHSSCERVWVARIVRIVCVDAAERRCGEAQRDGPPGTTLLLLRPCGKCEAGR